MLVTSLRTMKSSTRAKQKIKGTWRKRSLSATARFTKAVLLREAVDDLFTEYELLKEPTHK
jgi:hypothetical protein